MLQEGFGGMLGGKGMKMRSGSYCSYSVPHFLRELRTPHLISHPMSQTCAFLLQDILFSRGIHHLAFPTTYQGHEILRVCFRFYASQFPMIGYYSELTIATPENTLNISQLLENEDWSALTDLDLLIIEHTPQLL